MNLKDSPLISIITPAFNAAASIELALRSVIDQEYKNIEHIVVDGLSQDKTAEIITKYAHQWKHIRMIRDSDRGVYDAMNKGIEESNGDFLCFLGSDDQFYDKWVLTDLVKSGLLSEERVVYGNVKIEGDTGWAKDGQIYDGRFTKRKLVSQNICHQAIFYPKSLLSKINLYNIDYKINADWDLNWRCWIKSEFLYFDRIICNFRAGGTSTNTIDFAFRRDYMPNIQRYFGYSAKKTLEIGSHSPWGDLTLDPDNPAISKYPPLETLIRILIDKIKNLKRKWKIIF
ncbi:MAG: glycosyltransferase [Bacteroidales bacterium]|jgi:glycosyltransferase involved in cell wall biosynthesis|nr:glycosyltransferase [Bacteroidales bacterium]